MTRLAEKLEIFDEARKREVSADGNPAGSPSQFLDETHEQLEQAFRESEERVGQS